MHRVVAVSCMLMYMIMKSDSCNGIIKICKVNQV